MKNTKEYSRKRIIMLILLLILTIIIRLPTTSFPGTPDSYFLQGKSISIINEGYANWVLHPASLFGLYPISYPSAYIYLLSYFSLITGLTIAQTVQITTLLLGVIGTFGLFVFAIEQGSFIFAYLSALIFSVSIVFVNFTTAGNASARIFLISLLPIFMWLLLKTYKSEKKTLYITFSIILYILIAMAHRLVQLVSVILVAYLLTVLYFSMPKIWPRFKKTKFYKFYFERRYASSKKNIILDITLALFIIELSKFIRYKPIILTVYLFVLLYFIMPEYRKYSQPLIKKVKSNIRIIFDISLLVLIFVTSKFFDLLIRGRLGVNIERQIDEFAVYAVSLTGWIKIAEIIIILTVVLLVILGLSVLIYSSSKKLKFKKINTLINNLQKKVISIIKTKTHLCISILFLIIFLILFISQFFGHSIYSLSVEDYFETVLFKGTSPLTIFLNMVINYTTGTTILFPLVVLGLGILIFKKNKNFSDMFLLLIMMALSSILLDKRYVKFFVIPIFSLFIGIALSLIMKWSNKLRFKKVILTLFALILIVSISFSLVFANREYFFEERELFWNQHEIYSAAMSLKSWKVDKAVTGDPGAPIIVYGLSETKLVPLSYIHQLDLKAKRMSFKEIIDSIFNGRQIKSIWTLEDWINGGEYYSGKHNWQILDTSYHSPLNQRLRRDYQVGYFVRFKGRIENKLFISIEPIKNKLFDNPSISIWDINEDKGQV